eukprot:8618191-Pyramimonas_sp.AAC.1
MVSKSKRVLGYCTPGPLCPAGSHSSFPRGRGRLCQRQAFCHFALDLEKFVDIVSLCRPMSAAVNVGHPAIIVMLEVEMCTAPRFLKLKDWVSDSVYVSHSLVAGSPEGVQLAK